MKRIIHIAFLLALAAALPVLGGDNDDVVLYTNADIEKLEPLPTGRRLVDSTFDTEAWAFVEKFITRERAKITSDRDHELERERVEVEADRPVGYGERYPYYALRVPYERAYHGQRRGEAASGHEAPPATRVPHPMFRGKPPVREFTPGLGDSYRGAE